MPVRPAHPGDEEALAGLLGELYAAFGEEPPAPEDVRRLVAEAVAGASRLTFLVAEGGGGLDGVVSLAPCPTTQEAGEFVFLDDLYVRPGARGHGIALELLDAAARWAAARGAVEIRLAFDSADEGLWNLYREAGYERQRMNWMIRRTGRDWSGRRR